MEVKIEAKKKKVKGNEPDEKAQPMLWTEWSTGALVGAGSLWPAIYQGLYMQNGVRSTNKDGSSLALWC
jgi:hypothetical protein